MRTILKAFPAIVLLALAVSTYSFADAGGDTFKAKCAACHGSAGAGDTTMGKHLNLRDLGSADVQKQTDDELTTIVTAGKNKMPAYGAKLSKEQITAVVKFIRTLKK
jgi:mono/diheme cytochrome c family protein